MDPNVQEVLGLVALTVLLLVVPHDSSTAAATVGASLTQLSTVLAAVVVVVTLWNVMAVVNSVVLLARRDRDRDRNRTVGRDVCDTCVTRS